MFILLPEVLLSALVMALLGQFVLDRWRLGRFVRAAVLAERGDLRAAALRLGGVVFNQVKRLGDDPYFLVPFLGPLGATPTAVIREGGCCSGMSRLYITALHQLGVSAAQVTVYHAAGNAQHCLVEVNLGSERVIVDPSYGFSYHDADGGPLGLEQLRRGCIPHFRSLPGTQETHYPRNDYYDFSYSHTRTANWTKSGVRRLAYRVLHRVTRGGIDTLRLHPLMEWPQLLLAAALTMLGLGGVAVAAVLG